MKGRFLTRLLTTSQGNYRLGLMTLSGEVLTIRFPSNLKISVLPCHPHPPSSSSPFLSYTLMSYQSEIFAKLKCSVFSTTRRCVE